MYNSGTLHGLCVYRKQKENNHEYTDGVEVREYVLLEFMEADELYELIATHREAEKIRGGAIADRLEKVIPKQLCFIGDEDE